MLETAIGSTAADHRSTGKMGDNRVEQRALAVLRRLCRAADMDEAGDPFIGCDAELLQYTPVIGVPLGDPACRVTHGMGGKHQAHGGRAGGQLLLPFWNLDVR